VKLRAAYGESGFLPGALDASALLWVPQPSGSGMGIVINQIGNSGILPERTREIEVGMELEYAHNYGVDMSYYWKFGSDAIVRVENPPSTGLTANATPRNVGAIEGWGFESMLYGRPVHTRDFSFSFNLIYNHAMSRVTDLGGTEPMFNFVNAIVEGQPRSAFYVKAVRGALFDDAGLYAGPRIDEERSNVGNPVTPHSASLRLTIYLFRNLTLYALFEAGTGGTVFNYTRYLQTMYKNNKAYNELATQLGIAEQHGIVPVPDVDELQPGTGAYENAANLFAQYTPGSGYGLVYFEDSDHIRLRELSLRYDFSSLLRGFIGTGYVREVAFTLAANNLWLWTKYSGPEVELNSPGATSIARGQDFLTLQLPRTIYGTLTIGF
jgi:hypothetical protein